MQQQTAKTNNPFLNGQNETRYRKYFPKSMDRKIADQASKNKSGIINIQEPNQNNFYYDDADNIEWEFMQSHE